MSTRDFINRRHTSNHGRSNHGKQAQQQSQRQSAQRGRTGGQAGSRKHNGDRPTKTTTGWRQPTIGQGYAERFPGTSKVPIRNNDGSYSLNGRTYYGGSYRRGGHSGSGGKHGYRGFYHHGYVRHAYVPYGFYGGGTTIYINDSYLREDYPVDRYEEEPLSPDGVQAQSNEPIPAAATSAAAERYLREATTLFGEKSYPEAARRFRLAAIAAPQNAAPLFALGFALIALEDFPYSAKVIRRAIDLDAELLNEGGDVSAVFKDQKEFARVRNLLVARIAARPDDLHAPFLLGAMQYFSGDPAATKTFQTLSGRDKNDRIVSMLASAAGRRFKAADDLPEIQ